MDLSLLIAAEKYVFDLFKNANTSLLCYHNFKHTTEVVKSAEEIAKAEQISDDELEMVLLAAWFHDVGYLETCKNHEDIGVKVMTEFLNDYNYPQEKIAIISSCILATKLDTEPLNLLQEILCDADMSGLSKSNYDERTLLLQKECRILKNETLTTEEWLKKEVDFLNKQKYYTKYAVLNFNDKKYEHLNQKENQLEKIISKNNKADIPEKGIETMFRTALKNHMELSAMADNKANIMLSINALIISIVISALVSKFDKHPELVLPTVLLLLICLIAIVLATLSTKPKITTGRFTTDDVKQRQANLLFFGNFHNMKLNDYEWGMKEMMKDSDYLYSSLIRDLYFLGVVLAKKYTYLRWCYIVFMYGMIIAVLVFGITIVLTSH
ncbi:MAG: HD family phosphohydrolase [Bacteroidetes bacterium HGW-Bacteroidetes-12]|nr:MAG: HD family phosphohydrolase [Bacteroidetes bacterium HGW-Bacteroidetes-12]